MTLKPRASSNASGTTTIMPARSPNATPVPPVARMSASIPGSVSSRRISVRGYSPSVAGSTRVSSLSFKTMQTVEPLKNETPPRTRVASLTPSKKAPQQTLTRSPSASSALPSLKSPSISLTTPSPQTKAKPNSSSIASTPPSKFSLNMENSSTTTPSKPKLSLYSSPTHIRTTTQHPNTPGSKTGSPAQKNSLGRKSGSAKALLVDDNSLVFSRQPKTTALTGSNGTGTVVATDDGWLSGISAGGGSGDAFWEADDMSLEMLTDVNDGDVDEEVSFSFSLLLSSLLNPRTNPPSLRRWNPH